MSVDILNQYMPNSTIFIYILVAIGSMLLIAGLGHLFSSLSSNTAVNKRLALLERGMDNEEVLATLRRDRKKETGLFGAIGNILNFDQFNLLLTQAGIDTSLKHLFLYMTIIGYGAFLPLALYTPFPLVLSIPVAIATGFSIVFLYVLYRKAMRVKKFSEQLPDAIDLVVRGLKVGHPLSAALKSVSEQMKDPIGTEFGITFDEMSYGLTLKETINNLSERVPTQDLQFFAVAVNIQHSSGGNLAEVLANLSKVIRDRGMMMRKAKAISAEGRLTSTILTFLPFGLAGVVSAINPDFYMKIYNEPWFMYAAGLALFLSILNGLIMKWITNIKV